MDFVTSHHQKGEDVITANQSGVGFYDPPYWQSPMINNDLDIGHA